MSCHDSARRIWTIYSELWGNPLGREPVWKSLYWRGQPCGNEEARAEEGVRLNLLEESYQKLLLYSSTGSSGQDRLGSGAVWEARLTGLMTSWWTGGRTGLITSWWTGGRTDSRGITWEHCHCLAKDPPGDLRSKKSDCWRELRSQFQGSGWGGLVLP